MRLNFKEFELLIETYANYLKFANDMCVLTGANESYLDHYNGKLMDMILTLCGYKDDLLGEEDPVLFDFNFDNYDQTKLKALYDTILKQISDLKIKANPNEDIF